MQKNIFFAVFLSNPKRKKKFLLAFLQKGSFTCIFAKMQKKNNFFLFAKKRFFCKIFLHSQ